MLDADSLECVRGRRRLFAGLSFALGPGECLWVQGPNGSGKTSLLRILAGLVRPERGEVRWRGTPIAELGEDYRAELVWCGHALGLKDDLTPEENLRAWAAASGRPAGREPALSALDALGVAQLAEVPVRLLSQGQKRRASLARLALDGRRIWLLDEPLTSLDARAAQTLGALLEAHLGAGGVAVLASHQPVPARAPMRVHAFA